MHSWPEVAPGYRTRPAKHRAERRPRLPPGRWAGRRGAFVLAITLGLAGTARSESPVGAPAVRPAQPLVVATDHTLPSPAEIDTAVAKLRADPNLGTAHTVRSLRWKGSHELPRAQSDPAWIVDLVRFIGRSLSALLWVAGGLALAIAIVWVVRVLRARVPPPAPDALEVPSHTELDLRPVSLPADIGAAARELLEAGRSREAVSLLYRGALSRAVHRHGVTIPASSTEREALRAARAGLDAERGAYIAEVVALWQGLAYAGSSVSKEAIATLCAAFAPTLDRAPAEAAAT